MSIKEDFTPFNRQGTVAYFLYHLRSLPDVYSSLDTNRITVCYFCLSALDLLDSVNMVQSPEEIIEWIYSLQCIPQKSNTTTTATTTVETEDWGYLNNMCLPCNTELTPDSCRHCGFLGSAYLGGRRFDENNKAIPIEAKGLAHGHVAMTYTALVCLIILGDDLSRVAREPILKSLLELQQDDGRFVAHHRGGESDCRFVYCACAIAFILGGVSDHINMKSLQQYIQRCLSYDGGIGLVPGQESHGGSTYTALAGLSLCSEGLNELLDVENRIGIKPDIIAKWCLARQLEEWNCVNKEDGKGGFQGRPNKVADTCYTFWVLGALQILDRGKTKGGDSNNSNSKSSSSTTSSSTTTTTTTTANWLEMFDRDAIRFFLLDKETGTQDCIRGGFGKHPNALPDILHSYYGVCGLALIGNKDDSVLPLDASLSISQRSRDRLKDVQKMRGWIN
jgi:geranylgeranyl transferase type-1 subunit beta